mgnify:CR=1 FL=1
MFQDTGQENMEMRGGQGTRVSNTAALTAYKPSEGKGAVQPAVVDASTFTFESAMVAKIAFAHAYGLTEVIQNLDPDGIYKDELIYARLSNPSIKTVEDMMQALEPGADWAFLFPAGMAETSALLVAACHHQLDVGQPGLGTIRRDVVLYSHPVYGGTHALMEKIAPRFGFHAVAVDMRNIEAVRDAIKEFGGRVGLVYCETPANPTMSMVDIQGIADLLKEMCDKASRPIFAVDNTFGGIFQHPLLLGADVCAYSATKYLGGHSDLIGGFLVGKTGRTCELKSFDKGVVSAPLKNAVFAMRTIMGFTPSSEMAHKLFIHMQTYILRMRQQAQNATAVAEFLATHDKVEKVYFPTLLEGADAELYKKQMSGPSGMIAFELKDGSEERAFTFLDSLNVVLRAVSLGFVRSLAEHPRTQTHSDITVEEQEKMGITAGLIRLSIGLEEPEDIIADLDQAFAKV